MPSGPLSPSPTASDSGTALRAESRLAPRAPRLAKAAPPNATTRARLHSRMRAETTTPEIQAGALCVSQVIRCAPFTSLRRRDRLDRDCRSRRRLPGRGRRRVGYFFELDYDLGQGAREFERHLGGVVFDDRCACVLA